jgi:TPR repeat protein
MFANPCVSFWPVLLLMAAMPAMAGRMPSPGPDAPSALNGQVPRLKPFRLDPPKLSVDTLFGELIVQGHFEGWEVHGAEQLLHWPRVSACLERLSALADQEIHIAVRALTPNPVPLTLDSDAFFSGVAAALPRDGSYWGYKFTFYPESILEPEELGGFEAPIQVFLLRPVPKALQRCNVSLPLEPAAEAQAHVLHRRTCIRYHEGPGSLSAVRSAARQGHSQAQYDLAQTLLRSSALCDLEVGMVLLEHAAEQGHPMAKRDLEAADQAGCPTHRQQARLRALLRPAVEDSRAPAHLLHHYAELLQMGEGCCRDPAQALAYHEKAANHPGAEPEALVSYAMLLQADPLPRSQASARHYLNLAAATYPGHPPAWHHYACMLYQGAGGARNLPAARKFFKRAAGHPHAAAIISYSAMLAGGEGGPVDFAGAFACMAKLQELGHADAPNLYDKLVKREAEARQRAGSGQAQDQSEAEWDSLPGATGR